MNEKERQLDFGFNTPEVFQEEQRTELFNVPSDDKSPFLLNITMHTAAYGDVWIQLQDTRWGTNPDDAVLLPPIRLRSFFGGGLNPFIAEELAKLPHSFYNRVIINETKMAEKEFGIVQEGDKINNNSAFKIQETKGRKGIKIIGIQDDDEILSDLTKFIDIEVTEAGDVLLRQRHIRQELDGNTWFPVEVSGEMLFKAGKNGGKYPKMAEILKRLAERIARAKDNRPKSDF